MLSPWTMERHTQIKRFKTKLWLSNSVSLERMQEESSLFPVIWDWWVTAKGAKGCGIAKVERMVKWAHGECKAQMPSSPASSLATASYKPWQDRIQLQAAPCLFRTMPGKSLVSPLLPRLLWSALQVAASSTVVQQSSQPWALPQLLCQAAKSESQQYTAVTWAAHSHLIEKMTSMQELPVGARNGRAHVGCCIW